MNRLFWKRTMSRVHGRITPGPPLSSFETCAVKRTSTRTVVSKIVDTCFNSLTFDKAQAILWESAKMVKRT